MKATIKDCLILMTFSLCMFVDKSFADSLPKPTYNVSQRPSNKFQVYQSSLDLTLFNADDIELRENCSDIHHPPQNYSSCEYVLKECDSKYELFNYLELVMCKLDKAKVVGYIFLCIWLIYLLSLLSTTVDNFFVPVLHMLSEKLHLPPSIAGMTLLALGNGAPDIFVAFSALQDDDVALLLGALMGAGLFITTTVIGTVLLVTRGRNYNIDGIDFMRDIFAYIVVLAVIVAVAYDGTVYLIEAIMFPLVYVAYVAVVVLISFVRKFVKRRKRKQLIQDEVSFSKKEGSIIVRPQSPLPRSVKQELEKKHPGDDGPTLRDEIERKINESKDADIANKDRLVLAGLTWPEGFFKRVHTIVEWPFSLLRWLTIPPCCHDGRWSIFHMGFAVLSPVPMALLLVLITADGWAGYTKTVGNSSFPVVVLVVICCFPVCIIFFILLRNRKPPNALMKAILMMLAFAMSIVWLYIIANEVVSVLQALGLLASISTAILGLTVLAVGNSVADWVADTVVARKGKPEMAFASCFGAPLITHVMGLSFAFLGQMIANKGKTYVFDVNDEEFVHVKLSWIFLAISLFGSAAIFPLYNRFKPPNEYGIVLIYIYIVFMVFSVLIEADVMKINL